MQRLFKTQAFVINLFSLLAFQWRVFHFIDLNLSIGVWSRGIFTFFFHLHPLTDKTSILLYFSRYYFYYSILLIIIYNIQCRAFHSRWPHSQFRTTTTKKCIHFPANSSECDAHNGNGSSCEKKSSAQMQSNVNKTHSVIISNRKSGTFFGRWESKKKI